MASDKNFTNSDAEQLRTVKKKALMLKMLQKSFGMVTDACQRTRISRETHYTWLKEDAVYKDAVSLIEDEYLDIAESQLFKLIEDGNVQAIIFFLKNRGYSERPTQQIVKQVNPYDFSKVIARYKQLEKEKEEQEKKNGTI